VINHSAAFQIGKFACDVDTSNPNTSLVHWDVIFDTARHHAGTTVNAARGVIEKGVMFDISHEDTSKPFLP
jgi:hypothetical protein